MILYDYVTNFCPLSIDYKMIFTVTVTGTLKGYDQLLNLVLDEAIEFLRGNKFSTCLSVLLFKSMLAFSYSCRFHLFVKFTRKNCLMSFYWGKE